MTEFYQGNPCKRGHSGRRYASNGHCVECVAFAHVEHQREKLSSSIAVVRQRLLEGLRRDLRELGLTPCR